MLSHLRELYRYRDLLVSLVVRDIKVRYRQTVLGVAWAILQPLAFMLIFTLIFAKFGKVSSDGTPYPLFSYTGLVPWTLFATGLSLAVNSIAANMNLVKKIYFPREVFPIGVVLACGVDFLIASVLVGALMAIYRIPLSLQILWLPWLLAIEVALLVALSLVTSALNVFYRDIKYIVPLLVQLGLFVTPVIYSASMVPPSLQRWYLLNPMAVVIDGIRRVMLHSQPPPLEPLLTATALVLAIGVASYAYFKRVEVKFADLI